MALRAGGVQTHHSHPARFRDFAYAVKQQEPTQTLPVPLVPHHPPDQAGQRIFFLEHIAATARDGPFVFHHEVRARHAVEEGSESGAFVRAKVDRGIRIEDGEAFLTIRSAVATNLHRYRHCIVRYSTSMRRLPLVTLLALAPAFAETIPLTPSGVKPVQVKVESVTFKGRAALRVTDDSKAGAGDEARYAIVANAALQDGVIEVDLAGDVLPGASGGARGFVGMVFRLAAGVPRFECFYLRPTNGRAEDQERRNHSAQYISIPGFPWPKLRKETPERYESYVDLVPGEWTKVKIEVKGETARLYVHGNEQPTLIVKDLKQPAASGAIGLWVGPGTMAHFANLRVTK